MKSDLLIVRAANATQALLFRRSNTAPVSIKNYIKHNGKI